MIPQNLIDNPPYIPAKYFYTGRSGAKVELIVIHTMEAPEKGSTAESVAKYFQNSGVKASAHYCIDNNSIVQCVYDSNTAWACKNANKNGVQLEHAGFASQTRAQWFDDFSLQMLKNSAQIAAYLSIKFNIPIQRAKFAGTDNPRVIQKGFCSHAEVPGHGSHWDPGPNFPWLEYFDLINRVLSGEVI